MNKRNLSILLFISWLIIPVAGFCDYAIHLKNGGRFLTPQYWEEHQKIKFYIPGGVMGIEKRSVLRIDRMDDVRGRAALLTPPAKTAPVAPPPETRPAQGEKDTAKDDAGKDPVILGEFKALENKFATRTGMTVAELTDLKNKLTELRNRIVASRMKNAFLQEINKLADMRFFTNDLLIIKSRNK